MAGTSHSGEPRGDERRNSARFLPLEISISVVQPGGFLKIFGAKKENIATSVLDLSEGGMRVCLNRRVPSGSRVNVEFSVKRFQDRVSVIGDVLWLALHPVMEKVFVIGIRFQDVTSAQAQAIAGWRSYFSSPAAKHRESTRLRRNPNLD